MLLAAALVVLALSGAWLWFNYRPTAADAWPTVARVHTHSWIRTVHRSTAYATLLLALVTLVLLIVGRVRAGRRGVVAGMGVLVAAVAAFITGNLLPWDQFALWAVTVGNDIRGIQSTFDAKVKYVLIGSREVSLRTYHFWAITHVVLGLVVAAAVLLAWLRTREPARDREDAELVGAP